MKPKILFLYTEVADYFLAGVKLLSKQADVLIVRWSVNEEAPFQFEDNAPFEMVEKSSFPTFKKMKEKVKLFQPDMIICSGWMDKSYLKLVKQIPASTKVVSFDNHWKGGMKQKLATKIARKTILAPFHKAWVPGKPQVKYAQKLGFKKSEIYEGFYCANTHLFIQQSEKTRQEKWEKGLPKRFLYVGRYVRHKGIFDLWKAFISLHKEYSDWELWCVGTGEEFENRAEHPGIRHFGFLQPDELHEVIADSGVFVLPSSFEPWGVVVHEYAISGFPLLLSQKVGASDQFLKEGENGFSFQAHSAFALKKAMKSYIQSSEKEKISMSKKSFEMGKSYQSRDWCEQVLSLLND